MQDKIIILGAGVMQGPAIKMARDLGFYTIAVDGSREAPCIAMANQFEHIDLKDKEEIEAFARSLLHSGSDSGSRVGIMTAGTDFSASVAWVAEKLGLPGIPYETALNASDKARMRACFVKAGLPSPEFFVIEDGEFPSAPPIPFPLVIKPVDNMGGRGCRRVNSREVFCEAAADALRFSRSGRAIAEVYMDGPEFSVDAIVYHGEITICGLADRHIFFPPYFIEMGHTMPTVIPEEQQQAILAAFCAGVRALGLTDGENCGAAKGDIKLTSKGPMIGEIAARLSGGYMSGWTYPYASGAEPVRAAILAAMGRKPHNLLPYKTWTSAERAFISIPGTVRAIHGTDEARSRQFIRDVFIRAAVGGKVNFPQNNVTKCGNVISAAPDRAAAIDAAENAVRSILLHLEPADPETAEFLNKGESLFPPDAYQLTPELLASLEKMPETSVNLPLSDEIAVISFFNFIESGLPDYVGRSPAESMQAVRNLTGLSLPEITVENPEPSDNKGNPEKVNFLGRQFWAAFVRGGYQGATYYIDRLRGEF